MDDLMSVATDLMSRETRRLETAAQNVANSATPGYKRAIAFEDVLATQMANTSSADDPVRGMRVATDLSAGKQIHSGNPLDIALGSPGFFEVMSPQGPLYTRLGAFQRDADGRLVTAHGWPLQAAGGGDVVVRSAQWHIERDGTVVDDGVPGQILRVVQLTDPAHLQRVGDSLFAATDTQVADSESPPSMTQGYLESSNAIVGNDMIQLMDAMRRIEAGQKIVHAYDDMMGNVLQRLGDM